MGNQEKKAEKDASSGPEEGLWLESRKAKKYLINKKILAQIEKLQEQNRRRTRRYFINTDLLEANGILAEGSKIIDLSTNGARLELSFSPPFMSQVTLKFELQEKILRVIGRVIWSRMTLQKGRFEVGVQFYQNYWEIDHLLRLQNR